jgi:hypothetical protein
MRRRGFPIRGSIILAGMAVGLAAFGGDTSLPGQNALADAPSEFEVGSARHVTRTESQVAVPSSNISEIPAAAEIEIPPPTRSSFMASWPNKGGAMGYLLDVSTSDSFDSYVDGYRDLQVGNVTGRVVNGLNPGTTYYYRVRALNAAGAGGYSNVMTATTVATTGLTIHATFDSSITNHPNAAAIEAMINRTISIYESLFSDPITIQILYRYSATGPDGTPLPSGTLSQSDSVIYSIPWNIYINALRADAKTNNDNLANASLPGSPLSGTIKPKGPNGRAIGLNTPPAMFANGSVGDGGPFDGIVTLNSSAPFQFTRPVSQNNFDAQNGTEHETDEVIALASQANISNLRPQDLFSWSSPGVRNISLNGTRYFSINGGHTNIVNFNQNHSMDLGDWLSAACPQAHPYVQNAAGCRGQSSDVTATSPEGINLDVIGYDLTANAASVLGNISTRSFVQTGADVMIGGFIIQGNGPKTVIVRAIGPELTRFGVPNALADPTLDLHNSAGALIASNNNWQTTVIGGIITSNQVSAIQNSGHAPTQPSESAIIATLQPGNYTAIVRGVSSTTGVALVEVYDLSTDTASILGNISTRSFVQTGNDVMIGGFIVEGSGPKTVIVRAIGPELTRFGVPNALADPALDLHNSAGALIASNNNWQTTVIGGIITSDQVSAIQSSGHAPSDPSESAIIATLQPGNYTAIVRGVNNTTGVALVEVYDLQ